MDTAHEPNHRNYGVYEQQPATAMLASACVYCGKALQQPHSIEQGCGDICAKKYSVFMPTESANWGELDKALETAPEPLRKAVEAKVRDEALEALGGASADLEGAMKRVNHIVGHRWETGAADAKEYIGAAIEIANALGFTLVANKLTKRFIEGGDQDVKGGFKVVSVEGDMWEIDLGFLDRAIWWDTVKAMEHAGARRIGRRNVFDFPPSRWIHVLNVLTRNFSGELGLLPSGETFIVPEQPLPTPGPETEPAGAPDAVTDERPELPELKKGQVLELRDGREVVVGWVGPDRVGVMPLARAQEAVERLGRITPGRAGYEFVGTNTVALVKADKLTVERVEEVTGGEEPSKSQWVPVDREYPEKLYSYQRESALWCDTVGSGVLALDMGLGKSGISVSCADPPVVVICPASLRINWVREVNMWRPDLTATSVGIAEKVVKGRKVAKKTKSAITDEQLESDVVVINYDILGPENVAALKERGIKTLIVDEAHYIKEVRKGPRKPPKGSKRAVAVLELAAVAERRLMLTGTPMINGRPYELWPLLHAVNPEEWPSFFSYCKRYCAPQKKSFGGRQFTDYTGKANLEELREKTQGKFLLRKTKDELDLPEKARRSIELILSTGSKKKELSDEPELYEAVATNWAREYDDAARAFIEWVRKNGGPSKAMRAKRAEALAKMTALRRLSAMGKIDAMVDQCVGHLTSTGRPLVVMGHHKAPRQLLARALEMAGVRVGLYPEDGQGAIDAFQHGEPREAPEEQRQYLDVIICSIQAAGVGLTLTRASDMFFIERAWRAFDLVQAEDRCHRIGQTNNVTITYYDAAGTIDMKIREMLVDKAATALQVIDGVDTATDDAAAELVLGAMFGRDGEMQPNASETEDDLFGYEWAGAEL